MPIPSRVKRQTDLPDLQWMETDDGSLTLWNTVLDESYHSGCGAVAESLAVYLWHSGVLDRLQEKLPTKVFELGFGTASAFLLTAALADHFETPLEYSSVELRPLPADVLSQLRLQQHLSQALNANLIHFKSGGQRLTLLHFDRLTSLTEKLISLWPRQFEHNQTYEFDLTPTVRLNLIAGDALQIEQCTLYQESLNKTHAVYFDPFSPETSPQLWSLEMLKCMQQLLAFDGTLTSYCVKSAIRKLLQQLNLIVERKPGPVGGKREVLLARKPST